MVSQAGSVEAPATTAPEQEETSSQNGQRRWVDYGFAPWVEPAYRWVAKKVQPPYRWVERWLRPVPIMLMMAGYVVHFGVVAVDTLRGFSVPAFDFGVFDQGVWLLSRFQDPFVTVMGRNLFGDHSSYILVLVAPLYWLYPHGAALLVLQCLAIALGAVPVYLVARHFNLNFILASLLAGAYLFDPAVQQVTLEGFHPECFLPFFFGMAIYAAICWKPRLLVVMVVLSLLVKEDVGLLVIPLGLWICFRRNRRWGLGMMAGGAAWSAITTVVIMPAILGYFSPSDQGRMPFGGLQGFIHTLPPAKMWAYLKAQSRPFYLWQMLLPTGFGFVLFPEIAAVCVFALAENYLSPDPYEHQILWHYSLAPSAILLIGTAHAVGVQRRRLARVLVPFVAIACSAVACSLWGLMPFSAHPPIVPQVDSPQNRENAALVAMIPPNAVVSADTYFVAQLDHRSQIYLWPTPFRTGNYGSFSEDNKRLPVAGKVQYLLISVPPSSPQNQQTLQSLEPHFHLVRLAGNAALFERNR